MLKFNDLLYYAGALNLNKKLQVPDLDAFFWTNDHNYLLKKLSKIGFFKFVEHETFSAYDYGTSTTTFFGNFPRTLHPFLQKNSLLREPFLAVAMQVFGRTLEFGIFLPVFLCDLFKYYPLHEIPVFFDDLEFFYLDAGIQILPVLNDFLGQLLINDSPLIVPYKNGYKIGALTMQPPLEKNINFSEHIAEYYFGEGSVSEFKNLITLYLNNRLELKERCEKSWVYDKLVNDQTPNDLAVYFISHFLIKDVSKYTLRFVVANLDLSNKNPMKSTRDATEEKGNSFSDEEKKTYFYKKGFAEQKK